MSVQVKRRREAASFLSSFTGAQAELVVDTTNNRVQVHDGVTPGGWPAAKLSEVLRISRTTVADANYTILTTDILVSMTSLTASRTLTLPASSAYPVGQVLRILDESGAASASQQIIVAAAGSDVVDGASSAVIQSAYGSLELLSNGAGKWFKLQDFITTLGNLAALGINTAADSANPLSATLNAALFNALYSTYGGTGDLRVKLNKQAAANTASFQFQDNFSGRAEFGLTGDDNLHIKVSADGATWIDALDINGATGEVTLASAPAAGDSSSAAVTSAWVGQNLPGGFLNKFRNGTLDIWQRGTSAMTVATAGAYTADGWTVVPAGASCAAQSASGRALTVNSLKIAGASGVTDIIVKQRIESFVAAALAGERVAVQAQVYNNTGAAIVPTLTVKHPTAADNYAATTTDVNAVALQSCANGAWTRVAYTFAASSASTLGLEISFDFGNNFGSSANSIQLAELDIRAAPGVATGQNNNPPPPELRPIQTELAFCQRYLQTVGTNFAGIVRSDGQFEGAGAFQPPMRASPTVTLSESSPSMGEIGVMAATASSASLTIYSGPTAQGVQDFEISGWSGLTAGKYCVLTSNCLTCSSEI